MQFLPLGYHTFLDTPTDYDRVTHDPDTTERMHRRALRQARRRRG
jgi:hypothetical protein